ncbi:MAG: S1C family serine protease [Flavobacteriales bacterium]
MEEKLPKIIERFLADKMSTEEKANFEKRIANEADLAHQVNEYQKVFGVFNTMKNRNELKKKLDVFHQEIPKETKVISIVSKFNFLKIAASIALLLSIGTISYLVIQQNNESKFEMTSKKDAVRIPIVTPKEKEKIETALSGTAFMVSSKGYLVTAKHIVEDADKIMVENSVGEIFSASVLYTDKRRDIAVLKIDDKNFKKQNAVPYAFSAKNCDLGEKAFTLGFPSENIVFEEGVMSSRLGFKGDSSSCRVSLAINHGNSGGPLFDDKGNIIGMISGKEADKERAGFAITMKSIAEAIKNAPKGTFDSKLKFNSSNKVSGLKRAEQIKKIEPFVYQVRVD